MQVDLDKIYDETITVINKLDAKDAVLKQDAYYKTVLNHCMWSDNLTRNVDSDGTVTVGVAHQVQIPESENYLPYNEWNTNREDAFTLRAGDYVVKGEVAEDVTASTIKSVVKSYEPDAFQIQAFRDATKGEGFDHTNNGIMRFSEVYYVEG